MNLIYFKSDIGNFGDDLNILLWEKIFGDFDSYQKDLDFVGIGSILDQRILKKSTHQKIIFGSGVRDLDFYILPKDNVQINFVRGPISSRLFDNAKHITDAAYCLRLVDLGIYFTKKYKKSYIPYFRNYNNFNWKLFEEITGLHVINPTSDVIDVIKQINESEFIYTSAMHGAILADIYRIPWRRVRFNKTGNESNFTSELKWQDWLRSINLSDHKSIDFDFNLNIRFNQLTEFIKIYKLQKKIKGDYFSLSKDSIITEIDSKLDFEVKEFIKLYKK